MVSPGLAVPEERSASTVTLTTQVLVAPALLHSILRHSYISTVHSCQQTSGHNNNPFLGVYPVIILSVPYTKNLLKIISVTVLSTSAALHSNLVSCPHHTQLTQGETVGCQKLLHTSGGSPRILICDTRPLLLA